MKDKEENKDCHIKRGNFTEDNRLVNTKTPKKSKTDRKDGNERNDHESREDVRINIDLENIKGINPFAKK